MCRLIFFVGMNAHFATELADAIEFGQKPGASKHNVSAYSVCGVSSLTPNSARNVGSVLRVSLLVQASIMREEELNRKRTSTEKRAKFTYRVSSHRSSCSLSIPGPLPIFVLAIGEQPKCPRLTATKRSRNRLASQVNAQCGYKAN